MNKLSSFIIALALAAIVAGVYLWQRDHATAPEQVQQQPADAPIVADVPPEEREPGPEIRYPIEAVTPSEPVAETTDISVAITGLLGREAVLKFMQLGDFPRRVVGTVDNLARSHAAPMLWPVNPTPGKFTVQSRADIQEIAASNGQRYEPFVAMVQSLNTDKVVSLYVRLYPQFQGAYEELGYPRGYFNDRLVAVIDNLLGTPEPAGALPVELLEVKGDVKSERPWVRYQYVDPELEALSAGQKIMLRVGPANRKVLKEKLTEIRRRVSGGGLSLPEAPGKR